MKNLLLKKAVLAASMFALSSTSYSDTIFGIYAGAGSWNADPSGDVGQSIVSAAVEELGLEDNNNNIFYIAVEHPIPVLPNIRYSSTALETDGSGEILRDFSIGDSVTITAGALTDSQFDLSHEDITLYYEVLDNWVSIDLGITARVFDAEATVVPSDNPNTDLDESGLPTINETFDETIPMLYARAQFDLPFTGWHIGGLINYVSFEDNSVSDLSTYIGYNSDGLILDFGIDVGFRSFDLEVDDSDFNIDATLDGAYATFYIHF